MHLHPSGVRHSEPPRGPTALRTPRGPTGPYAPRRCTGPYVFGESPDPFLFHQTKHKNRTSNSDGFLNPEERQVIQRWDALKETPRNPAVVKKEEKDEQGETLAMKKEEPQDTIKKEADSQPVQPASGAPILISTDPFRMMGVVVMPGPSGFMVCTTSTGHKLFTTVACPSDMDVAQAGDAQPEQQVDASQVVSTPAVQEVRGSGAAPPIAEEGPRELAEDEKGW